MFRRSQPRPLSSTEMEDIPIKKRASSEEKKAQAIKEVASDKWIWFACPRSFLISQTSNKSIEQAFLKHHQDGKDVYLGLHLETEAERAEFIKTKKGRVACITAPDENIYFESLNMANSCNMVAIKLGSSLALNQIVFDLSALEPSQIYRIKMHRLMSARSPLKEEIFAHTPCYADLIFIIVQFIDHVDDAIHRPSFPTPLMLKYLQVILESIDNIFACLSKEKPWAKIDTFINIVTDPKSTEPVLLSALSLFNPNALGSFPAPNARRIKGQTQENLRSSFCP